MTCTVMNLWLTPMTYVSSELVLMSCYIRVKVVFLFQQDGRHVNIYTTCTVTSTY